MGPCAAAEATLSRVPMLNNRRWSMHGRRARKIATWVFARACMLLAIASSLRIIISFVTCSRWLQVPLVVLPFARRKARLISSLR